MRVMALLFGLGIFVAACSDDNQSKPPADRGVDIVVDYDAAWPDSGLDMATDAPAPDAPAADAAGAGPGSDAKPDGAKGEASVPPDKGNDIKLDAGNPLLWGYLSRSVTPGTGHGISAEAPPESRQRPKLRPAPSSGHEARFAPRRQWASRSTSQP